MSSSSRKRLLRQLDDSLAEIERLKGRFQRGIEQLERSLRENLSPTGCTQWFALVRPQALPALITCLRSLTWRLAMRTWQYLRVVDLGLQIRRGEIRHRSARQVKYSCMHTTGIKGAKHSGGWRSPQLVRLLRSVIFESMHYFTPALRSHRLEH